MQLPKKTTQKIDKQDTYTNFGKDHMKPEKIEVPKDVPADLTIGKLGKGK